MLYCAVMKNKTENLYGTMRPNEETVEHILYNNYDCNQTAQNIIEA